MPRDGLTTNQELYCAARMRGLTQRAAYREAYPRSRSWKDSSVDPKASELESGGKVAARLAELRAEAARAAVVTRAEILSAQAAVLRKGVEAVEAAPLDAVPVAVGAVAQASDRLMKWLPDEDTGGGARAFDFGLLLGRAFSDMHRWIAEARYSEYWLPGGRGSLKTTTVCEEVVWGVASVPGRNAVAMRDKAVKLRTSIYAEMRKAARRLGVLDEFTWTVSPMRAVHRGNGNAIHFFGADAADPADSQIKGFAPEQGYTAYLVVEEASQFPGYAYVRSVRQTLFRGSGGPVFCFLMYNPPRSARSWVNEECARAADGRVVVPSCYLDAPPEWLGEAFLADAEALRESDPAAYEHEYLGVPTGTGLEVFDRAEFRDVPDSEIARFDNPVCGQDFGWSPDPWAAVLSNWDPATRTLTSYREAGGRKLRPDRQAELLREMLTLPDASGAPPAYRHLPVRSDDADPSAIDALRGLGIRAVPAGKGGMRTASYRFLQSARWVIDPARCPRLAAEVRAMEHEVTRAGEVLESIPDGNDHWVDATRYSMMPTVLRSRRDWAGARARSESLGGDDV